MSEITVVIPTKGNPESLENTLTTLYDSTNTDYKLIVVNGGEDVETQGLLNEWEDIMGDDIKVIEGKWDSSIKAMNAGFKKAKGHVLLTHDDITFFRLYNRDWMKEIITAAKNPKVGMVTSLNGGGQSGPDYLDKFKWIGTWFTMIPEHTIKTVGYLDEQMTTGDDIDYSYRVLRHGYGVAMIDYWVEHHMSNDRTHDKNMAESDIVKINGDYFKKKHGFL